MITTTTLHNSSASALKVWHVLRVVGLNLLFIVAGLTLIAVAGEAYLRYQIPFRYEDYIYRYVPGVGMLLPPLTELRATNGVDFWNISRTNSLGFLNREPIDIDRAASSCHITVIGDSFVHANEVDLEDKLHIRLDDLAARELPALDVTTSAFGLYGTAQINQLAFYDGYAQHMRPDMVVLVFVNNDFRDNSLLSSAMIEGWNPDHPPYVYGVRSSGGTFELQLPDPDFLDYALPRLPSPPATLFSRSVAFLDQTSYLANWIIRQVSGLRNNSEVDAEFVSHAELLRRRPEYESLLRSWTPTTEGELERLFSKDHLLPFIEDELELTRFALEQFKLRTDHDGASLAILLPHVFRGRSYPALDYLRRVAAELNIPVIDQWEYILRHGLRFEDARWDHDSHWNATGHQWAAEAIIEYIEEQLGGECPAAIPQPEIEIERIPVGHYVYTDEGKVWTNLFPKDIDDYRAGYAFAISESPVAHSDFDIYLKNNVLSYIKDPCVSSDVAGRFILNVVPEDVGSLREHDRARGFDNMDFDFDLRGAMFDDICFATVELPEYRISSIETGQWDSSGEDKTWLTTFPFDLDSYRVEYEAVSSSGEPLIRSRFDVYLSGDMLFYVRESCLPSDISDRFFLHIVPLNVDYLPAERKEHGFDNLDFDFGVRGATFDGVCFAKVELPAYEISQIRTGQWIRGEGNVWEEEFTITE